MDRSQVRSRLFGQLVVRKLTEFLLSRDAIADQILWEMPDIIGLQEVESHQLSDMSDLLRANYDFVGVGRDDGQSKGEVKMSLIV